jgi:hypothetical protein
MGVTIWPDAEREWLPPGTGFLKRPLGSAVADVGLSMPGRNGGGFADVGLSRPGRKGGGLSVTLRVVGLS